MILLIDNYDSFTWNLVHRIAEVRPGLTEGDLLIRRNDEITPEEIEQLAPTHIILSPGPCSPREAGNSCGIVRRFAGRTPILGVCLGHQCIAEAFGMPVTRSEEPIHGKSSLIAHDGRGLFAGLPSPFQAARYHSLVVREEDIGEGWEVSAWLAEEGSGTVAERRRGKVVMGLRRAWRDASQAPLEGVQFHPESFMTPEGGRLLSNFLSLMDLQPRTVQIPPELLGFLKEVSELIERGDPEAMIESDDLLQCDFAYGGRNEEGGNVWGFTYLLDSGHKWELAFTREQLRDIAAGQLTTTNLWFCTREGCESAFPDTSWDCPHYGLWLTKRS